MWQNSPIRPPRLTRRSLGASDAASPMDARLVVREDRVRHTAWPSIAFAICRPIGRGLRVDQPFDCPLTITVARRYWWVRWAGFGVGAWPMVEVTLTNRSSQAVHSFSMRFVARPGGHASGIATQPKHGLPPGAQCSHTLQEPEPGCVAVCVDFVQFVSGDVWCSADERSLVTEAGVQVGARAAASHLLDVLTRSDAAAVIAQLPRVHADVLPPATDPRFGSFGFYNGVTNVAVRLRAACERDGLKGC